jgi:hypothetical protein
MGTITQIRQKCLRSQAPVGIIFFQKLSQHIGKAFIYYIVFTCQTGILQAGVVRKKSDRLWGLLPKYGKSACGRKHPWELFFLKNFRNILAMHLYIMQSLCFRVKYCKQEWSKKCGKKVTHCGDYFPSRTKVPVVTGSYGNYFLLKNVCKHILTIH